MYKKKVDYGSDRENEQSKYNKIAEESRYHLLAVLTCVVFMFMFVTYAPKSPSTAYVTSLSSPEAGNVAKDKISGTVVMS